MKYLILIALLFKITTVQAKGHSEGNGGAGHFCANSAEFYDLFEGRERYKYNMVEQPHLSMLQTVDFAINKVRKSFPTLADLMRKAFQEHIQSTPGIYNKKVKIGELQPDQTNDANNLYHRAGCETKTIINWDEPLDMIVVNSDLWNRLPSDFQRGVGWVHEIAYKVSRDKANAKNSDQVRKFVAQIFSDQELVTERIVDHPYLGSAVKIEILTEIIEGTSSDLNVGMSITATNSDIKLNIPAIGPVYRFTMPGDMNRNVLFTYHTQSSTPVKVRMTFKVDEKIVSIAETTSSCKRKNWWSERLECSSFGYKTLNY